MPDFNDLLHKLGGELSGYDAFLCTLGSRVKTGVENFKRVDYEYPLEFARLAKAVDAFHYGLLTSGGADPKSMFLYMRTKGEVERDAKAIGVPNLNIYRPGLLTNRDNDMRIGEKIFSWVPFIPKIDAANVGKVMLEEAIVAKKNNEGKETNLLEHGAIVRYYKGLL